MNNFKTIQGKSKILFSAPHAHPHRRPSLVNKYKEYERYTDNVVRDLCSNTKSFGIYTTDQIDYDPNYHKNENPYKKEVKSIVEEYKIEKFVDIHGLNDDHMVDVAIYYKTRFTKSIRLAEEISKLLNMGELKGLNIQVFRLLENDQRTLTEFCASQLRIPSVQIEIARYIRKDKGLREAFVNNLSDIEK